MEIGPAAVWQGDIVATRTSNGRVFFLVSLRKSVCEICRYGTHFDTTWASPAGDIHRISWCKSCFNAECAHAELDAPQLTFWHRLLERAARVPVLHCWNSARPAIEDLERRGLV